MCTKFYQNQLAFVEDATKTFWCVLSVRSVCRTVRAIFLSCVRKNHKPGKVAINDALPLKAARRDAIAKLKSFCFESELHIKPSSVSFRFAEGRHVNAA